MLVSGQDFESLQSLRICILFLYPSERFRDWVNSHKPGYGSPKLMGSTYAKASLKEVEPLFTTSHLFKWCPDDPTFNCLGTALIMVPRLWAMAKEHAGYELDFDSHQRIVAALLGSGNSVTQRVENIEVPQFL